MIIEPNSSLHPLKTLWYDLKQNEPSPEIKPFLWTFSNLIISLVSLYEDSQLGSLFLYESLASEASRKCYQ